MFTKTNASVPPPVSFQSFDLKTPKLLATLIILPGWSHYKYKALLEILMMRFAWFSSWFPDTVSSSSEEYLFHCVSHPPCLSSCSLSLSPHLSALPLLVSHSRHFFSPAPLLLSPSLSPSLVSSLLCFCLSHSFSVNTDACSMWQAVALWQLMLVTLLRGEWLSLVHALAQVCVCVSYVLCLHYMCSLTPVSLSALFSTTVSSAAHWESVGVQRGTNRFIFMMSKQLYEINRLYCRLQSRAVSFYVIDRWMDG